MNDQDIITLFNLIFLKFNIAEDTQKDALDIFYQFQYKRSIKNLKTNFL